VTPDDARKLIGGYATGSLSEAERKLLFEAALDDQDLFDQLAGEQDLKALLDEPGAKQRLIAALETQKPVPIAWWKRPLTWSVAGTLAAGMVIATWMVRREPAPVEVARLSEPASAPAPPVPFEEKKSVDAEKPAPARLKRVPSPAATADKKDEPAALVGAVKKDQSALPGDAPAAVKQEAVGQESAKAQTPEAQAPKAKGVDQAASQSSANQVQVQAQAGVAGSASSARAQAAPAPQRAPAFGIVGGLVRAPSFGFDYNVDGQTLVLTFAAAGYISIHFSPGSDTIVGSRVEAGSTRREALPNNATEASIVFTALPQTTSGGVSLNRDSRSGTVTDPTGARIELLLRIY